jgi:hypothetical protein
MILPTPHRSFGAVSVMGAVALARSAKRGAVGCGEALPPRFFPLHAASSCQLRLSRSMSAMAAEGPQLPAV